jgi:ribosomal protein S18
MQFDKSFRSRYNFVANFFERTRNFAKNDFVLAKQNSNRFLEHYFVAKVQYILLSKEQQILSKFEFSFARHVLANHLALRAYLLVFLANYFIFLAKHFVFLTNHEFHAANFLEKFVTSRAKISHQSRKFVVSG